MKKLAIALIACLAFVQTTYAATSALAESLLEQQAITTAIGTNPEFQNIIPAHQFIIDIRRVTKRINILGDVFYKIVTRSVRSDHDVKEAVDDKADCGNCNSFDDSCSSSHHHRRRHTVTYIAKLNVAPNPGIGPNIVTVLSIKKVHK